MYSESDDVELHKATFTGLKNLLEVLGMPSSGFELGLDIGGGYGIAAPFMQQACRRVYVSDIINFTAAEDGLFAHRYIEKCVRNGLPVRSADVEFHFGDAQNMIYRDGLFDFIYSVNAFEHIPDPIMAWSEIGRVARPGAVVAMQFDPIWTSAFGHHLFELNFEPWDHLVLAANAFEQKILELGGDQTDIETYRSGTNRRPFRYQRDAIQWAGATFFERYHSDFWDRDASANPYRDHLNFKAAVEQGYAAEDLCVRGFNFAGVLR
jgi:SAM-dependent methyltransferase